MKQEEAARRIQNILKNYEHTTEEDLKALVVMTKAFEKETPKKPERLSAFKSIGKCGGC